MTNSNSLFFNNTYKLLSDCSNNALNVISKNETKYFNLLNEKEKMSYHLLERDTELFKKKNELNTSILIHNDKDNQLRLLKQNAMEFSNKQIEHNILFNQQISLFNFEGQKIEDNIKLQLTNGIKIEGLKSIRESNSLCSGLSTKLFFSINTNSTHAETLSSLYKEDSESALLYLAFNL